jgi:cytochrome c oxidase subunit 4
MEPNLNKKPAEQVFNVKPETPWKHVFSFFWMILFTAIAFWMVMEGKMGPEATFWWITGLAVLQVFLQLFTFMHLDFQKYRIVVIFLSVGIIIAVVSAVGIALML